MKLSAEMVAGYLCVCQTGKMLSSDTVKAYKIDLSQYLMFCGGKGSTDKSTIERYIEHLNNSYKPKSVKRKAASLKAFFAYLYREEIIEQNPFDKIYFSVKEPIILPKTIPASYIERLLNLSYLKISGAHSEKESRAAVRSAAVIELLFASGVRVSELCGLKKSDVNLADNYIKVYGKGSKERYIQIENESVLNILKRLEETQSGGEYFFQNPSGEKISQQAVRETINRMVKECGLPIHITPHMFRHSFATLLLDEGVDIRCIQKLLGHSSITTTQIYTQVSNASQRAILAAKHPRNKMKVQGL